MPNTMTLISTLTATSSSGITSFEFTSIPATYTDLCIKVSSRQYSDTVLGLVRFNGDTGNNYNIKRIYGYGSASPASNTSTSQSYFQIYGLINPPTYTSSTFSNGEIYVPNYGSTSNYKSISGDSVTETNAAEAYASLTSGVWNSNSAITSVSVFMTGDTNNNQQQYSCVSLYGIKNS